MTDYVMVDVDAQPYIYSERSCSMDPSDISENMGIAFQAVVDLIAKKGITSAGKPLAAYYTYDENVMTFRAGFFVSPDDASKAEGDVKSDVLPAGRVLNYIHKGPYAKLRVSYDKMMAYLDENNLQVGSPTWEIYLNEPDDVASEEDLETDIYISLDKS